MSITEGISTSIYDKRDAFDFPIVNFPNLSGNIPNKSAYGTFICELVRYARGCTFLSDFASRTLLLVKKLKSQGFTTKRLQQTYQKFCTAHLILIQKFDISVLDIHKEWKDQSSYQSLSDNAAEAIPTHVKTVRWSDGSGGSPVDIRTHKRSLMELQLKRIHTLRIKESKLGQKLYFRIVFDDFVNFAG